MTKRESNIVTFAKEELRRLRGPEPDEMQDMMERRILKMCRTFSDAGHSGFSASYAIGILKKLLRFEPITPLTGEDDEWNELGEDQYQNRRCSHVFKEGKTGQAYDIDGRIFREPDGVCFTSKDSRVYVTFPYRPSREYVDVPADRG